MGIIGKLLTLGPGGPVSIAKTVLKSYNVCRAINVGISDCDAFREVIGSRYTFVKKLNKKAIDVAAISAESIGDVITMIIYIEIPVAFSADMLGHTLSELNKFYCKNAPDEVDSLTRIPVMIKAVQ